MEPAVFGVPILIGNNHLKFPEAAQMINHGGVLAINNSEMLNKELSKLLQDENLTRRLGQLNSDFIKKNKGAVIQILDFMRI